MARPRLTPKQREVVLRRNRGHCWRCGNKIEEGEAWHGGHEIPHWLKPEQTWLDLLPEHASCNMADAPKQAKASAKTKRMEKKRNGHQKQKKPIPSRGFAKHSEKGKGSKLRWDWRLPPTRSET